MVGVIDVSATDALDLLAGGTFAALGALVLFLRGRSFPAFSFGAFCLGLGAFYLRPYALGADPSLPVVGVILVGLILFPVGIIGIMLTVPRGFERHERANLFAWGAVALALAANHAHSYSVGDPGGLVASYFDVTGPMAVLLRLIASAGVVATIAAFTIFPFRFAAAPTIQSAERSTLARLSVAFAFLAAGIPRDVLVGMRVGGFAESQIVLGWLVGCLWAIVPWLRATRGADARLARNVALAIPAILLAGTLLALVDPNLPYPIGRTIGVALLGYAVLRGQIAGLDVTMRWTISKSTIAAVFIAVFFVASEAAQEFFGDSLGSTYVGIAAAGALVFAMAPLQRAAERLAEKAVPIVAPTTGRVDPSTEAAYKAALRAAMRDGAVTRREERHLAEVARALGIDPVQAHAWRVDVEREPRDG